MKDIFLTLQDVIEVFENFNIEFTQKHLSIIIKLRNDKSGCALLEQQQRAGMPWQSVAGIVAGAVVSTLTEILKQNMKLLHCTENLTILQGKKNSNPVIWAKIIKAKKRH